MYLTHLEVAKRASWDLYFEDLRHELFAPCTRFFTNTLENIKVGNTYETVVYIKPQI